MSKLQRRRALLTRRRDVADEEIFGLFETTLAGFKEELSPVKENEHSHKLQDAVLNPKAQLHSPVFPANIQQLLVIKEEDPPQWSPNLEQKHPEPLHIKEEQDEVWTSQEGEQLNRLEEPDITRFPSTAVPVKSEDEEKPQSSQLHQSQTEDNREAEPPVSSSATQIKTESDGEDCGGSEPARNQDPDGHSQLSTDEKDSDSSETEDSDDDWQEPLSDCGPETEDSNNVWEDTRAHESDVNALKPKKAPVTDVGCNAGHTEGKRFGCDVCGKRFNGKTDFKRHVRVHTGQKPFGCDVCGKRFNRKINLMSHMRVHTGEKPFGCDVCGKEFNQKAHVKTHMGVHTGEKPFGCDVCGKRFNRKTNLKSHIKVHTGEKPFGCDVCGNRFNRRTDLKRHMRVHTGEKPFSCDACEKRFNRKTDLKRHMQVHTGEKPFSCDVCGKRFHQKTDLKRHMPVHTGEKPFSCDFCGRRFNQKTHLKMHMKVHTGEK
ncbi:zinc finger protein 260-like [Pempheris klunzingeri]|uniref:zinc finger protein 260-like n=1 Tax=Pempheris klunzingeri TaxID=3127111 RepID=UPI00397FB423